MLEHRGMSCGSIISVHNQTMEGHVLICYFHLLSAVFFMGQQDLLDPLNKLHLFSRFIMYFFLYAV